MWSVYNNNVDGLAHKYIRQNVACSAILLLIMCAAHCHAESKQAATATPIKHLVIIFQENVSFDHYFGTYPHATNPSNEPAFHATLGTPTVNGYTATLLEQNPNRNTANGAGATNPFRLDRSEAV